MAYRQFFLSNLHQIWREGLVRTSV